jgi:hypothetical protein
MSIHYVHSFLGRTSAQNVCRRSFTRYVPASAACSRITSNPEVENSMARRSYNELEVGLPKLLVAHTRIFQDCGKLSLSPYLFQQRISCHVRIRKESSLYAAC